MRQLTGLDTSFIHLESAATPMHIGSLAIYDQSTAPGGHVTFKDILAFFESRLDRAAAFRQRLVNVPLGLDNPYWADDPNFDLEFHVRHIALPQPGDWRQLCIQVARLHARPLDMSRPLWEAYIIEGLDNVEGVPKGAFALVTKMHHAAIDGVSGAEISEAIHDLSPNPPAASQSEAPIADTLRAPTVVEQLGRSALRGISLPLKLGRVLVQGAPTLTRILRNDGDRANAKPARAPRTRFNDNVTPHRVFDGRSFPMAELNAIRGVVEGSKLNDVIVTICGGALRKYLSAKAELPERSLIAMAPKNIRTENQNGTAGNQVTVMSLPIRSDIEDPLDRLSAVFAETQAAKDLAKKTQSVMGPELVDLIPPPAGNMLARLYASASLAERLPPIFNTVITNVPGPNVALYSMGSKMVASFGLGPAVHGLGLFQPVVSYNGQLTISIVACREMMPDPAFYCQCLQASFDELKAAAIAFTGTKAKPKPRRKKTKSKKTE